MGCQLLQFFHGGALNPDIHCDTMISEQYYLKGINKNDTILRDSADKSLQRLA
jgi:hypothetical protein